MHSSIESSLVKNGFPKNESIAEYLPRQIPCLPVCAASGEDLENTISQVVDIKPKSIAENDKLRIAIVAIQVETYNLCPFLSLCGSKQYNLTISIRMAAGSAIGQPVLITPFDK